MKPGRFWFSVPSPYITHEPKHGRACRASPQFISIKDGSWFGTSACIERITQISSIISAVCANSSLTSIPLWPYLRTSSRAAGDSCSDESQVRQP
jgi:hypothetical protein